MTPSAASGVTRADGEVSDFLIARIAEDEAIAQDALHPDAQSPGEWITEHHDSEYHSEPNRAHIAEDKAGHYWSVAHEVFIPIAEHMARHDPARVLAECEAKRRIVNAYAAANSEVQRCIWDDSAKAARYALAGALQWLALPYVDHPDYRQEWKP